MTAHPKSFSHVFVAALAILIVAAAAGPALAGMKIARKGLAEARVVVAPGASETERFAAEELALFLRIVTGAGLSIVEDVGAPGGRLLVGLEAARTAAPDLLATSLAPEEIVVRSAGQDLILAGGSPRGTLYAVYTFLEDVVGCRFWTGTASRMPWRPSLEVGTIALRFRPPLEYREPFWFVAFDPVWAARNKANGTLADWAAKGGRAK